MKRQVLRAVLGLSLSLAAAAALAQSTPRPVAFPSLPGVKPGQLSGPCKLHLTGAISADLDCQVLARVAKGMAGVSVSAAPGPTPASIAAVFSLGFSGEMAPGRYTFASATKASALAGDKNMPGPTFLADKDYKLGDGSLRIDTARPGSNLVMPMYEVHGSATATLVRGPDGTAPERIQMRIEF